MSARVTVITGPARSGKTEHLLDRYRGALAGAPPGGALWLAPTHRSSAEILGRLLGGPLNACLAPNVMTFERFAEAVVQASSLPVRRISRLMKRQLIRVLIDEQHRAGKLEYFAAIAHTHGLVDLVTEFISELKRLEIWPEEFRRACRERGMGAKDRELVSLYEAYQKRLTEHQLYDAEGRFWSARAQLREGQRRPFENLRLVVADGFADFTRTQHEILEILAERVEELVISLPLEDEPRRDDLFAKSLDTLKQLHRRHTVARESAARTRRGAWPAMEQVEAALFRNPPPRVGPLDGRGIEIYGASRELGEVELVGRKIKQLLLEGCPEDNADGKRTAVHPGEIAVVFRSLHDVAPLVREVFDELGLPYRLEFGPAVSESPLAKHLAALLRLVAEDWPFRQLLGLLSSNYFQPNWPEWQGGKAPGAAERVIRQLQVPSGAAELLDAVRRMTARLAAGAEAADDPQRARRVREKLHDAQLAEGLLTRLQATLARLPARAAPSGWAEALKALCERTGCLDVIGRHDEAGSASRDAEAAERIWKTLADGDALLARLDEPPREMDAAGLLEHLDELLPAQRLPRRGDETGVIRVLSASSVRALEVPYLFFCGLSERAFPAAGGEGVYGEAESQALQAAGLPLLTRAQKSQDEMLLFYEVLTRARRRLWLSYPALDERAEPLLPSPYLEEVQRACGGALVHETVADLSPVPRSPQPLCPVDHRVLAVDRALGGQPQMLAGLLRGTRYPMPRNLHYALRVVQERAAPDQFGMFEGMLSRAARGRLTQKFPPELHWSPSQLEQYAYCPFQFFMERVLQIEPLDELALEVDYLQRGGLLHEALARLHERINQAHGGPTSPVEHDPQQYQQDVHLVVDGVIRSTRGDDALHTAMLEIDRRLLSRWVEEYRGQHGKYDDRWKGLSDPPRPSHFEVSFGMQRESADPLSSPEPLELNEGDETVKFSGRIDRIDVGHLRGRPVFNIVDYKSGRPRGRPQEVPDGTAVQLELYAMAAERVLFRQQALPWASGYWYVRKEGYRPWQQFFEDGPGSPQISAEWQARREQLTRVIFSLVRGIRAGQYPMFSSDAKCISRCPYSTVCRVNHARALEKRWTPPQKTPI